jgi:adenosylhomocysteine nucleosidase
LSRLGIVSALAAEARHLCQGAPRPGAITELPGGALLIVSGMGGPAAAAAARMLVKAGANALLSFGLAGGLDPGLVAGTVCLPAEVVSREGVAVPTTRLWREALRLALASRCLVTGGKLLTSPVAIDSVEQKALVFRETGACLVDMESLSVGQVAGEHRLAFMAVRVIVDTARDALPPVVSRAAGQSGQVPLLRLIAELSLHPQELPAMLRLGARYRAASRSLAAVARSGSLAPHAAHAA